MQKWIFDLGWMCGRMKFRPRTVCECAVGPMEISIARGFQPGVNCGRLLLIEPLPRLAEEAENILGARVHRVAIGDNPGRALLVDNGGSSYLMGTWAPTPKTNPKGIEVPVITFDTLDDGEIDVLNLDCEGQEWSVLRNMKSRPRLLAIEVWSAHPHRDLIDAWMVGNNYYPRFSTGPESETTIYALLNA